MLGITTEERQRILEAIDRLPPMVYPSEIKWARYYNGRPRYSDISHAFIEHQPGIYRAICGSFFAFSETLIHRRGVPRCKRCSALTVRS
jgi:hypothetical protein